MIEAKFYKLWTMQQYSLNGCDKDGKIIKYIEPKELKQILEQDFYFPNTKIALDKKKADLLYKECKERFK